MALTELKISSGWNNAAGLAFVEDSAPTYNGSSLVFMAMPLAAGILRTRADGTRYTTGRQTVVWRAEAMSVEQYEWIRDTLTTGGNSYSGPVTIRTYKPNDTPSTYTLTLGNYSATLLLPMPSDLEFIPGGFLNVDLQFIIEAAL